MTDAEIIGLYRWWSEETYCSGWYGSEPSLVTKFREWLPMAVWTLETAEDYELEMLAEFHRQEALEVE